MRKRKAKASLVNNRLMVSLRPDQRAVLQSMAQDSGISESHVVRLIVGEFLERTAGKDVRFQLTSKKPTQINE